MTHRSSRLVNVPAAFAQLTFASMACVLMSGCVAAYTQPPYVEPDAKAKAQDQCQAQAKTQQEKDQCLKKPDSK